MILRLETADPKNEDPLAQALSQGDENTIVAALKNLTNGDEGQDKHLLSLHVFDVLQETTSHRIRNAAALALVDLGVGHITKRIIDVLRRTGLAKGSGTLLFALNEINSSVPLSIIMDVIENGSFESRSQAMCFLEDGRFDEVDLQEIEVSLSRLTHLMTSSDHETVEAADYGRDCLVDYAKHHKPGP